MADEAVPQPSIPSLVFYNHDDSDEEKSHTDISLDMAEKTIEKVASPTIPLGDISDEQSISHPISPTKSDNSELVKRDQPETVQSEISPEKEDDNMDIDDDSEMPVAPIILENKIIVINSAPNVAEPMEEKTVSLETKLETTGDPFSDEDADTAPSSPQQPHKHKSKSKSGVPRKKAKLATGFSLVSYELHDDDDDDQPGVDGAPRRRKTKSGSGVHDEEDSGAQVQIHISRTADSSDESDASSTGDGSSVHSIELGSADEADSKANQDTSKEPPADGPDPIKVPHTKLNRRQRRRQENLMASSLARAVQNMPLDQIQIPPEPDRPCSPELQRIVASVLERNRRHYDLNQEIQDNKAFRNPSIYEKLITYVQIDEKGTNFPPQIYDPYRWGPESFYEELAKSQDKEVAKREKERKEQRKVEFVSATKTSSGVTKTESEPKKRSKWDTGPPNAKVSSSSTDAVKTVIPAVGNLLKMKKESTAKQSQNAS